MNFIPLEIPEVVLIQPRLFKDERGFFLETWRRDEFAAAGIASEFVQDNHSGSVQGVLRGLHYQIRQAQGKLLRVVAGEIFDVAVDIRHNSPTFGRAVSAVLSAERREMLWVPPGFAHGFYTLSGFAELLYRTTDYYAPQWERSLLWNDPALSIDWPLVDGQAPILAAKDAAARPLIEAECYE